MKKAALQNHAGRKGRKPKKAGASSSGPHSTASEASLLAEVQDLRLRLAEANDTLRAIRQGEVDALVVAGPEGDQTFTLQGAETPYRFLIEEMNEGAMLVQPDGTILYANARFAHLAGSPLEQLIGASWERCFVPDEQARLRALLSSSERDVREEFHLQTKQNRRPVEVSLARLKHQGVEGFSVIITDLVARKMAEAELRRSNARLQELVGELEQFSYSITHDMRAPLRAMRSFAGMVEESCAHCVTPANLELLRRIGEAATRLDMLIQGSLNYAQIVREDLALESVDLANLVPALLQTYPNLQADKVDIEIAGPLPLVKGNQSALTQVFSNLLDNAVKFVAPSVRPCIRIWAEGTAVPEATTNASARRNFEVEEIRQGPTIRVWIEDNGIGIPERAQSRIFDMFQRANKTYEGTGIGLAIVRKIVERLGGHVGVQSEEGKGSRFWVDLQSAEAAPA